MIKYRPVVVDLFCGAGGFSLGFKQAGFHNFIGFDTNHYCGRVYEHNLGVFRDDDVKEIHLLTLKEMLKGGYPTILIASPPCQLFSSNNSYSRLGTPSENMYDYGIGDAMMLKAIKRIIENIRPEFFALENVKGYASCDRSKEVKNFLYWPVSYTHLTLPTKA